MSDTNEMPKMTDWQIKQVGSDLKHHEDPLSRLGSRAITQLRTERDAALAEAEKQLERAEKAENQQAAVELYYEEHDRKIDTLANQLRIAEEGLKEISNMKSMTNPTLIRGLKRAASMADKTLDSIRKAETDNR